MGILWVFFILVLLSLLLPLSKQEVHRWACHKTWDFEKFQSAWLSVLFWVQEPAPPLSTHDAIRHIYLRCKDKNYLCMRTHNFASSPLFRSRKELCLAK